jgi:hypothetical protein
MYSIQFKIGSRTELRAELFSSRNCTLLLRAIEPRLQQSWSVPGTCNLLF